MLNRQAKLQKTKLAIGFSAGIAFTSSVTFGADHWQNLNLKIDSQKVGSALLKLSKQAGVQIVLADGVDRSTTLPELNGEYSLVDALNVVLKGTDLTYKFTTDDLVVIKQKDSANQKAQGEAQDAEIDEVMVTGTRIRRTDTESVGPVTVLDEEGIKATGITSLETLLQKLPSAAGFAGNQTNAYWVGGGWGTTQVNLRGLGVNRTLVLVNGRRVVFGGSGANSSVDLSMIPMSLISRVEVLKDGASATYGADAVAGVVNLITKDKFEGFEVEGKFGITEKGDGEESLLGMTWGVSGDKSDFMVNFSYQNNEESPLVDRAPCPLSSTSETECSGSSFTIGGRTTLPIGAVLPDGTVLISPTRVNFNQELGGDGDFYEIYNGAKHGFNYNPYFNAVQPIERFSFSTVGSYNISDSMRLFSELMYTHRESNQPASPVTLRGIPFAASHPTNPTGVDFVLERRRLLENGARHFSQEVDTWRVVTGFEGEINDSWSYEVAFNWGRNSATDGISNNINVQRLGQTLDTSTCGSNGIPCIDLIGFGEIPPEALDYIVFSQMDTGGNEQKSISANISGELFELPAGTVGFAGGVDWREESGWRHPDSTNAAGISLGNREDPVSGEIESKEIYGEVHIPVLADSPFFKSLDLDLALRYSDYKQFKADSTYKVGVNWQITDAIKVRGTMTTAFRVPNIPELFGGLVQDNMTTIDPCSGYASLSPSNVIYQNCQAAGVPIGFVQLDNTILTDRGGNPNLEPETAETLTLGVVLQPFDGLSFTIDYFDIDIENAIRETPGSIKLSACYNSTNLSNEFCGVTQHTRDSFTGDINFLSTQKFNSGREVMKGYDLGAVYNLEIVGLDTTLDIKATYLKMYETTAFEGDVPFILDGFIGGGNGGYPHWRANASLTTKGEQWSGTYSVQMIGKGDDFNRTSGIGSSMPAVYYHNTQLSYAFSKSLRIRIGIDNLLDEKAPRVASWTDGNTDTMTYDLAGRRGYISLTYRVF